MNVYVSNLIAEFSSDIRGKEIDKGTLLIEYVLVSAAGTPEGSPQYKSRNFAVTPSKSDEDLFHYLQSNPQTFVEASIVVWSRKTEATIQRAHKIMTMAFAEASKEPETHPLLDSFRKEMRFADAEKVLCAELFFMLNESPDVKMVLSEILNLQWRGTEYPVITKIVQRQCNTCQKWRTTAHEVFKCSRCLLASYCDAICQSKDWPKHKLVCVRHA